MAGVPPLCGPATSHEAAAGKTRHKGRNEFWHGSLSLGKPDQVKKIKQWDTRELLMIPEQALIHSLRISAPGVSSALKRLRKIFLFIAE